MATYVRINAGSYRNADVANCVFELNTEYQPYAAGGGFVVVNNAGMYPGYPKIFRIKVSGANDYQVVGANDAAQNQGVINLQNTDTMAVVAVKEETDEEVMTRIRDRFEILDDMTKATLAGDIRAMIVTGPPGVGKSYGVERELEKASLFDRISGKRIKSEIVKGTISAIGLFALLYKYSDPESVLVFDDCDVWEDQDTINILKGALDSGKTRRISYNKDSRILKDEGVPNAFNFHGSVIFITNHNFDSKRASKIQPHLDALQSRSHFLDLSLDTLRDKWLRIKQIAADGALFAGHDFEKHVEEEILEFIEENKSKFREMSLRMAGKVADLRKSFPLKWKSMAKVTCMRGA